ncbi:MAG: phenylalanine--tRNA ligase subunit beta [Coriobacteriia bacterium]|nr:phenylalanine--tRNA ligase subunit beta [Coriobacteriia bacterium]
MRVSLRWLKQLVKLPSDIQALTSRLDLTGTAVDAVIPLGDGLEKIVVGQIVERERHPDSDHLWVTKVDVGNWALGPDGQPERLQIVCGAQNFVAGDKVPVALVGAILPGGLTIKKAKMRGIESRGMNCSARELGIGSDADGIMVLPAQAPIGLPIAEYLELADTVLDLEITPNRPDCMSMLGVAREIGAVYDEPYGLEQRFAEPPRAGQAADLLSLQIDDAVRCPRYTAQVIRGVKVGPSPQWLVDRVTAAGARPINNIVDVSNYIMFEYGQPLHTFDLNTLVADSAGRRSIVVRAAAAGEAFTTLDGVRRELDADITCIVDGNANGGRGATVALAGVMGGLDSEVSDQTVDILLESAAFSGAHTSRTSRKLQLFSEASARFERGVDPETCLLAAERAAALIVQVAGGSVCADVLDLYPAPLQLPTLKLRGQRLAAITGAPIPLAEAASILQRLGCTVTLAGSSGSAAGTPADTPADPAAGAPADPAAAAEAASLDVIPPSFRPDLTREIDLIEEVLRIWGMEKVVASLPGGRGRLGRQTLEEERRQTIGQSLRACGLNETMTYSFALDGDVEKLQMGFAADEQAVQLINPMNAEQSELRRSILPGLLRSAAYNLSRGVADIQLYELGAVFMIGESEKLPREPDHLAAVLVGSLHPPAWNQTARAADFFDAKGILDCLLDQLHIQKTRYLAVADASLPWLQAGRAARVMSGKRELGWLGELDPRVAKKFEIEAAVVAFDLDVQALLNASQAMRAYLPVPQYPAVQRDLAIVVDDQVAAERLEQVMQSAGGALLADVRLFDLYVDEKRLGAHKKSLAFSLEYRAPDRTLTSEEVEKAHEKLVSKLVAATGGEIR